MSVGSRLRRLEAGVRWLETEGVVQRAELALKLVQTVQAIADHKAGDKRFAARWKKNVPAMALPKPRVKIRRRGRPTLRDAAVQAAPQGEEVRIAAPPSQPSPRPPPLPPPQPPKSRWTKDIRPGPHDVLTSEEAMQVPWLNSLAEDDGP